jgi:FkbM family methyltransferase
VVNRIRKLVRSLGFDVIRYPRDNDLARRMKLVSAHRIDVILDVGANIGQYARDMRGIGYRGRIVSFEPITKPFAELRRAADRDPSWTAVHLGIGESDGERTINVSQNVFSSSLLAALPALTAAAPAARYVGNEVVQIRRLDGVFDEYVRPGERVLLKIDTQGYEPQVIDGAAGCINRIAGIQVEMSLVPLYAGERLFSEIVTKIERLGFTLMSLEQGLCDAATGQWQQCDGVFFRS